MSTNNLTLLSQGEIDILVNFLTSKAKISSEILSQNSIDKLINILRQSNTIPSEIDFLQPELAALEIPSKSLITSTEYAPGLELFCEIDEKTNYILLYTMDNEKQLNRFLPASEKVDHVPHWGYCIAPKLFADIAQKYNFKYSDETYAFICDRFAELMFGNKDAAIPAIYLPIE